MTDREYLELAAKAAGIKVPTKKDYPYAYIDERGIHRDISCDGTRMSHWNPITDDGDALRLAVRLNLLIVFHPVLKQALVREYSDNDCEWFENGEDHSDPLAATRRAIVRAAAEIGRGMK